jgi:hypothetical protein
MNLLHNRFHSIEIFNNCFVFFVGGKGTEKTNIQPKPDVEGEEGDKKTNGKQGPSEDGDDNVEPGWS